MRLTLPPRTPAEPKSTSSGGKHSSLLSNPRLSWANVVNSTTPVDLSALLSNLSPEVVNLWKQPIPITPLGPSQPARKLQQQRRLPADIVQQLVFRYQSGSTVVQLAKQFGINRETALEHLKRAGIARRPHIRKLTDEQVEEAERLYATGLSLKSLAKHFEVNETTIRSEFTRAGIQVRPRRGWDRVSADRDAAALLQLVRGQEQAAP